MSTGMPRPLSTTVTELSACTVTLISSRSQPSLRQRSCPPLPNEMVQAHLAGRTDIHRGTQAHGLEPAENLDRFRVVLVAACGVPLTFSLSPMSSPGLATADAGPAALDGPRAIRSRRRAQNSFSVKQGRRVFGMFRSSFRAAAKRPTPYPLIPVFAGQNSRTRRVPAPSHLAQRDVAKTHVSPGPWPPSSWREAQILGHFYLAGTCRFGGYESANRQPKNYTRLRAFSQSDRMISALE